MPNFFDPVDAVQRFGYSPARLFAGPTLLSEPWQNLFVRCGAGKRKSVVGSDETSSAAVTYQGFHVHHTEAHDTPDGDRECLVYLTADLGYTEAELTRVGPVLAAELGVARVDVGQRDGRWFVLVVTNRAPKKFPPLLVRRVPQAAADVPLTFDDGSGRVETLRYETA